jgi:pyruvate dehydrogenase E1 component beta subunit
MMTTAIRHPDPVLVCSHKHLYGSKGRAVLASALGDVPDEPYEVPIGAAEVRRPGSDVTIVGALLMVHRAIEAADHLASVGIDAEVIDLRWLSPMDTATVVASVRRTGRCLIVQEGSPLGGWSGTVAAAVADGALDRLDAPVRRLTGPDHAIPFAPHLEAKVVPTAERIVGEARALVGR